MASTYIPSFQPPTSAGFVWRTESDKYKQWDGCIKGNYLPEPLACRQHEDIRLFFFFFLTEPDSRARWREGRGKGIAEQDWKECKPEQGAADGSGREAEEQQELKVLNLWSGYEMQSETGGSPNMWKQKKFHIVDCFSQRQI